MQNTGFPVTLIYQHECQSLLSLSLSPQLPHHGAIHLFGAGTLNILLCHGSSFTHALFLLHPNIVQRAVFPLPGVLLVTQKQIQLATVIILAEIFNIY